MKRAIHQVVTDLLGVAFLAAAGWVVYSTESWGVWSFSALVLLVGLGLFLYKDQLVTRVLKTTAPYVPFLQDPDE